MKFSSHGRKYELTSSGAIHQLDAKPYVYDAAYSATYDSPEYTKQSDKLMNMRLGFVMAAHGKPVKSLLDYGYGNGAFMKVAKESIDQVAGYDVTGVVVPPGCDSYTTFPEKRFEVVTFWDCLEHLPEPMEVLNQVNAQSVVVSLPFCHHQEEGLDWFGESYKHRKPDEHLWHHNKSSLSILMANAGFNTVAFSTFEDVVRKSAHGLPNILTMAFKRPNF